VDVKEWVDHAMAAGIHADRIAFIRFRSNLLHNFDPNTKTHAFPSPRSWFMADKAIAKAKLPRDVEYETLKGIIGEAAATEYTAFIRAIKDLPTVDEIALTPDTIPVPAAPNVQHALTTTLSMATTTQNFSKFMLFMERMPKEFQVVYIRDCLNRVNNIKFDPAYKSWGLKNASVIV
jgi:hypothetical protein